MVTPLLTTRVFSAVEAVTTLKLAVPALPANVTVELGIDTSTLGSFAISSSEEAAILGMDSVTASTDALFVSCCSSVFVAASANVITAFSGIFSTVTVFCVFSATAGVSALLPPSVLPDSDELLAVTVGMVMVAATSSPELVPLSSALNSVIATLSFDSSACVASATVSTVLASPPVMVAPFKFSGCKSFLVIAKLPQETVSFALLVLSFSKTST